MRCAARFKLMEVDKCGPEYRNDLASSADRPAVDPYLENKKGDCFTCVSFEDDAVDFLSITCPTCWQSFEIDMPAYSPQEIVMVTDCEICCRPMQVTIDWPNPEDEPIINVERES